MTGVKGVDWVIWSGMVVTAAGILVGALRRYVAKPIVRTITTYLDEHIRAQLTPNHGGSIFDKVTRVDATVADMADKQTRHQQQAEARYTEMTGRIHGVEKLAGSAAMHASRAEDKADQAMKRAGDAAALADVLVNVITGDLAGIHKTLGRLGVDRRRDDDE